MILIVTNKTDLTADYLIIALKDLNYDFVRFNLEDFPQHAQLLWDPSGPSGSFLRLPTGELPLSEITSVWYRRPVDPDPHPTLSAPQARRFAIAESKEAITGILESLDCFWVSRPSHINRAENKLLQLATAQRLGLSIPQTLVTNIPQCFFEFYSNLDSIINKPIKLSRLDFSDENKLIYTSVITKKQAARNQLTQYSACLFQEHLPKEADIRVTVMGRTLFPVLIHVRQSAPYYVDWRRYAPEDLDYSLVDIPQDISNKIIQLMDVFDLNFSAMDFMLTRSGKYVFLEMNPNGQWAWIQESTGLPLRENLAKILHRGVP